MKTPAKRMFSGSSSQIQSQERGKRIVRHDSEDFALVSQIDDTYVEKEGEIDPSNDEEIF